MNVKQPALGVTPAPLSHHGGRHSPNTRHWGPPPDRMRCMPSPSGNFFSGLDDGFLARAEAMGVMDISKPSGGHQLMKPEGLYGHTPDFTGHNGGPPRHQMPMHPHPHHHPHQHHGFGPSDSMFDQLTGSPNGPPGMPLGPVASMAEHHNNLMGGPTHPQHHQMYPPMYSHPSSVVNSHPGLPPHPGSMHHQGVHESDCDPRELEMFAERFKQRRIKLGVTQADVGAALANLKIPGVGCLSQSTICRFESLTLSHNNMIALKPILQTWLEDAEKQARERKAELENGLNGDKKRKRTSIAAPEKRSLEAYFAVQPRPSGEKIAQIAEKLDLKKNVVRVWFCNQRQKQKRMKFSAIAAGMGMGHH
ncbi:POU domain, class 4, transcription factor 2-like [Physella acuta]|uniref:POU domain, class 4, transcription factor 2-like n=1 Tax=Physella acuta TaxID=109671 RepID=UPI0027DAF617|nr:POU domain, class 4, transcription factor 2-like [Physella acuta]